nr:tRNA methyltransferase, has a role in tRNA modification [Polyrhizophydium stewartii]
MLGSDRSAKLVGICRERGFDAMICDGLMLPYRSSAFDFAISIAVIHHFATPERRQHAIAELLRIVRPGGSVLIFVWALEQESQSRRKFDQQDVFVPWKMPKRIYAAGGAGAEGPAADGTASAAPAERTPDEVYQRYYHMFVAGELDALALATGMCSITASGYDRDNHYVILERRP